MSDITERQVSETCVRNLYLKNEYLGYCNIHTDAFILITRTENHECVYEKFLNLVIQNFKAIFILILENQGASMTIKRENWKCNTRKKECGIVIFITVN